MEIDSNTMADIRSLASRRAVVFWVDEQKFGDVPATAIPKDRRFVGATGKVKYGRTSYDAKVLFLSDDRNEIKLFLDSCLFGVAETDCPSTSTAQSQSIAQDQDKVPRKKQVHPKGNQQDPKALHAQKQLAKRIAEAMDADIAENSTNVVDAGQSTSSVDHDKKLLALKEEHQKEIALLKAADRERVREISALKAEITRLNQVLESKSSLAENFPVDVTPGKVAFMERLTSFMKRRNENERPACSKRLQYGDEDTTNDVDLTLDSPDDPPKKKSRVQSQLTYPRTQHGTFGLTTTTKSLSPASPLLPSSSQTVTSISATSPSEAGSCQSEGQPSPCAIGGGLSMTRPTPIPLVPDSSVCITPDALSAVHLAAGSKPEGLVRALLVHFFTSQELANGCALGLRAAVNKESGQGTVTPLNRDIITAIKRYVLVKFRQSDGKPVMTEKDFNSTINSKCGTVRRKLKALDHHKE